MSYAGSAGIIQAYQTGVADLAVGAGDLRPGPGPVGGAFPAAGCTPLVASQVAGLALQVARVGDPLPVRCHSEVLHPQVNADGVPGPLHGLGGIGVDGEGHVTAAVRL